MHHIHFPFKQRVLDAIAFSFEFPSKFISLLNGLLSPDMAFIKKKSSYDIDSILRNENEPTVQPGPVDEPGETKTSQEQGKKMYM
jgi:hypothetical protein